MAAHEVPADLVAGRERALEIDRRTGAPPAEGLRALRNPPIQERELSLRFESIRVNAHTRGPLSVSRSYRAESSFAGVDPLPDHSNGFISRGPS